MADSIQPFLDHKAISDRLSLWCHIVDTRDLQRMSDVFDEQVEWNFGMGTVDYGLPNVLARINAHLVNGTYCGATHHHLANLRVEIDGDVAESEAYFFAAHAGINHNQGHTLLQWGNYKDVWKRRQDGWRIIKRIYRIDISDGPLEIVYGSAPPEMWKEHDERRLGR